MMFTIHEKTTYNSILTLHEMLSRTLNRTRHIIIVALGVLFCGLGVRKFILVDSVSQKVFSTIVFLVGLYYIFHVYAEAYYAWSKNKNNPYESYYEFGENSFTYTQGDFKTSTYYSRISRIYRGRDAIFLVVDEHVVHYLDCGGLEAGNTDELSAFLQEKTGKEFGKT